jgi:hypothetical protein
VKLDKILKKLSDSVIEELDAMSGPALEKAVAQSEENISRATRERDANKEYKIAKAAVSDLSAGLRDAKAYQNAKIQYALLRLREMGQGEELNEETRVDLSSLREAIKARKPKKNAAA